MPVNFPENKENIEVKRESDLKTEIDKLKKILEVKERELKEQRIVPGLKQEISQVREKLKTRSVEYEKIAENREEKDKNEIRADIEEFASKRASAPTAQQIKAVDDQIKDTNSQHQLSVLVNLALTKSVYLAIKTARKIGNAYLLDRFHDIIVNELYEELVKNKKIKPIK